MTVDIVCEATFHATGTYTLDILPITRRTFGRGTRTHVPRQNVRNRVSGWMLEFERRRTIRRVLDIFKDIVNKRYPEENSSNCERQMTWAGT